MSSKTAQETQVAILAGGLGQRLRPLTEKCPKPLVAVAGQPFLHWQLTDLKAQGFRNVLLLVSYLGEQIEAHFGRGDHYGLKIEYAYEPEPLGTGGALKLAQDKLRDEFVLLNGDSFLRAPLGKMIDDFHAHGFAAMISVFAHLEMVPVIANLKVKDARVLDYQKDAGRALGFDRVDSGIYILRREVLDQAQPARFMLADLWPPLIASGRLGVFAVDEKFYDIGTPERLKEFEEKVRDYFPNTASH